MNVEMRSSGETAVARWPSALGSMPSHGLIRERLTLARAFVTVLG
jgi:hypothetical protein